MQGIQQEQDKGPCSPGANILLGGGVEEGTHSQQVYDARW